MKNFTTMQFLAAALRFVIRSAVNPHENSYKPHFAQKEFTGHISGHISVANFKAHSFTHGQLRKPQHLQLRRPIT